MKNRNTGDLRFFKEAPLRRIVVICAISMMAVVPVETFAQSAGWLTGVWWKDCTFDIRYEHAYDKDHTYGRLSASGGWKIEELRRLADGGDACMQYLMGTFYFPGGLFTATDTLDFPETRGVNRYLEAAKYFRLAAEQGHAGAQESLAGLYWQGSGVREDYVEAANWYLKAANQGLNCSQLRVGEMYESGQGVRKDDVRAHMWMKYRIRLRARRRP